MSTVIAVVCPHCGNEGVLPKPGVTWQPIETAPRDGKEDFLVLCPSGKNWNHHQMIGRFAPNGRFVSWPGRWTYEPTHWMPLPDQPGKQP